ncbi:MAG: hypothetical protein ACUVUU_07010 [bacterium]
MRNYDKAHLKKSKDRRESMYQKRNAHLILVACILLVVSQLFCSDESGGPSTPPDTEILSGPAPNSIHPYRGEIVLSGSDPDPGGYVSSYEYAWLDGEVTQIDPDTISNWQSTDKDTLRFELKADIWSPEQEEYLRTYTFVVRAVDNHQAHDPSPELLSFTVTTTPPSAEVTFPGPEGTFDVTVAECVTIRWKGNDADGSVVMYRYALKGYDDWPNGEPPPDDDTRWSDWISGSELIRWLNPDVSGGVWSFYLKAMDNAGAIQTGFENGKNHIRLHIDTQKALKPSVTLYCFRGSFGEKGSLIATRSNSDSSEMEIPVEVTSGDSIHFTIECAPGKHATDITGIAFRQNDEREPYSWEDPVQENQYYPKSGFITLGSDEETTIYAWAKDNYCEFGSTARAYMIVVGVPPSP